MESVCHRVPSHLHSRHPVRRDDGRGRRSEARQRGQGGGWLCETRRCAFSTLAVGEPQLVKTVTLLVRQSTVLALTLKELDVPVRAKSSLSC
jgi:hypothetical protein